MEIKIKKLTKGFFVEVIDDDGHCIDQRACTGKWNMYPILGEYLFSKEENEKHQRNPPRKTAKKKL